MANKRILKFITGFTRKEFEEHMGGGPFTAEENAIVRTNKRFATYKGPWGPKNKIMCFCRHLATGKVAFGRTWTDIAKSLAKPT